MCMSAIEKNKSKKSSKPRWKGHRYQLFCIARGFEQKFLAYFLDPGLGKTGIILSLYKMLKLYGKSNGVLIIAPIRVCYLVWPLEIMKWCNFKNFTYNVMHGPDKNLWDNADADFHIINPEGLPWLLNELKGKKVDNWPFNMLVNDESTLFKNFSSVRFKNLKKLIPKFSRRYILTGTPIPNGYLQLLSQIFIVDEGRSLGKKIGEYRYAHFEQYGPPQWKQFKIRTGEAEVINKKIAPFTIRLSASDHLSLPPLIPNPILIDLPKKVRKQYDELEEQLFLEIDGKDVYPPTAASVCQKLHQICSGNLYEDWDVLELGKVPPSKKRPYFHLHKEKIHALEELIAELNGKPIFVAYWYHHELIELQKHFKNARVINSKTSDKEAMEIEKQWNSGSIPVLFAQPASVAHGLNFQGAGGDVCWYSLIYDFEVYAQFIARLWRQGAKCAVRNHFLIIRESIDELIYKKLNKKKGDQQEFFDLLDVYQIKDLEN